MKQILFFYCALIFSCCLGQNSDSLIGSLKNCNTDSAKVSTYNAIAEASFAIEDDPTIFKYTHMAYELILQHYKEHPADSLKPFFKKNEGLALNNLGYESYQKRETLKALSWFKKAVAKYRSINEREGLHSSLMNIASILESEGDLDDAIAYYNQLIQEFEQDENKKNLADNLHNLGTSYANSYDYPNAEKAYRRALLLYGQNKDSIYYAQALKDIADVRMVLADSAMAAEYYSKALGLVERFNDKKTVASCKNALANIYQNKQDYSTAEKYYLDAFDILVGFNDLVGQATLLRNYASMMLRKRDTRNALVLADSALRVAKRSGSLANIRDEAALLGLIYKTQGNEAGYKEMDGLFKAMGDSLDQENVRKQAAFKKFREDYKNYKEDQNKEKTEPGGFESKKNEKWLWIVLSITAVLVLLAIALVRKNSRNDSR